MRREREGEEGYIPKPLCENRSPFCFHSILPCCLASFLNSNPPSLPSLLPFSSKTNKSQSASAFVPAAKLVQPAAVAVGRKAATSMKLDLPAVVAGLAPAAFLTAPAFAAGMDERREDG